MIVNEKSIKEQYQELIGKTIVYCEMIERSQEEDREIVEGDYVTHDIFKYRGVLVQIRPQFHETGFQFSEWEDGCTILPDRHEKTTWSLLSRTIKLPRDRYLLVLDSGEPFVSDFFVNKGVISTFTIRNLSGIQYATAYDEESHVLANFPI